MVAWFNWIGEITAMRMLFNGNNSYHHFIMSKILKSFLFNFPNWSCLWEPCAYPYFPMWKSVVFPWISSPHGSLGLAHHRYEYCRWELSDAKTQTLSGPLTLIRSLWCLDGQMVVVAIRAPGLTPLPIAGWLALCYEALVICYIYILIGNLTYTWMIFVPGANMSVNWVITI